MRYRILKTPEYQNWLKKETPKSKVQIASRLASIEMEGYFGNHKDLGDYVWELKWTGGRRIYYAYIPETRILLLLGGNKNGQSKDIAQAKKILRKHTQA